MHQSFTGNARRGRHVNLGGRQTANPWASLSGSAKSSHNAPAAQSTIVQAQAGRQRRQNERDRVTASRKVQQTWRGHAARRYQKSIWRGQWDENERRRVGYPINIHYENALAPGFAAPAYLSSEMLISQLRLLIHFQEFRREVVRDEIDSARVLYFANALRNTAPSQQGSKVDVKWKQNLSKFGVITVRHIKSMKAAPWTSSSEVVVLLLSRIILDLAALIPDEINANASFYLKALQPLIGHHSGTATQDSGVDAIISILSSTGSQQQSRYAAFASEILSDESLSYNGRVLSAFATRLDQDALARAVAEHVRSQQHQNKNRGSVEDTDIWQLAYLIYFRNQMHNSRTDFTQFEYLQAFSLLLGFCANEIADRLDAEDHPMGGARPRTSRPLAPFIRENISLVAKQEIVQEAMSVLSNSKRHQRNASHDSDSDAANLLANYAVAVLRAFPSKVTNIRMWLYQGSVTLASGKDVSIIQYFWSIASRSKVFKKVSQNHRNVMSVLREAATDDNQIGRDPVSPGQIDDWREEWRIILLFLELYSFVLKLMDDDQFFSLDHSQRFGIVGSTSNQIRRSALSLSDIASMTTFLKNLAFTLYWNVADLVEIYEAEEKGGISALFGAPTTEPETLLIAEKSQPQTLTGNGVSQSYLKDLVTGLLRMLHERDSRRKFLPANHWLMTSQVDMTGFIPAVVAEEERRHELTEDDKNEDQDETTESSGLAEIDEETGPSDTLLRSVFGIRAPHTPRSMTSRHSEKLERQRTQARKRRHLELLAPRLEILRNLPFFIPFETRVQIFREFVFRDQVRRRDGYVDPDIWRMNIASTTQGRGVDGRTRGFDMVSRQHAEIHRESVFEDAYTSFYELGDGLKEPIQISFIDKFGSPEAGIDGGGVTKEFLMSVTSEAFDPNGSLSMFQENDQRYLYPNPVIFEETAEHLRRAGIKQGSDNFTFQIREFLRRFEFLGRVVGKCLYEGILIDVNFAGFFLLKWALTGGTTSASNETAYRATINDLRDYDEQLYQGLLKLKNYPGDVEADFSLNFTVTDNLDIVDDQGRESTQIVTRDLMPNGSNVAVTNLNRPAYIDRIVRYRLQEQPRLITNAFLKGLGQIVQPMWLAMFNQKELQKLVGGDNSELDIADLRRNTLYGGLYVVGNDGLEHPTVDLFWKVLKEMDDGDRRKVLKFVTSTPRAPLLGFSHLNPKFSIRDSSEDQERLPSTSTCVNLLKLPRYGDEKTMKEKLLYAVNSGAGFDLS